MEEGWYLMSTTDLEVELARWRGDDSRPPSRAQRLSVEEALAFRNRGNMPDELGRSLRLVLRLDDERDLADLDRKRLHYEPDFFEAPSWRRPGSKPVNVGPLRAPNIEGTARTPWWAEPEMAEMEAEWIQTGAVDGVMIPEEYRSFVYKTVALLRRAEIRPSVSTIGDSISRWLTPEEAARVRTALEVANASTPEPERD